MSAFETVIGLEVHVELATNSKIFCGCSTQFGAPPNSNTCPICLGHPGTLLTLNRQAVEYAMKAAMALNCHIASDTYFDRKHYFYPDNPKAYQVSQDDRPIGEHGWIDIDVDGKTRRIGVTRVHLEEDAGKLIHADDNTASLVDYNRAGTPLIEIVSEPDIRSPEEARAYLEKLKAIIQYTGVSDVRMEEGSLRCDANISLRERGARSFGPKVELKNMNSFRSVQRGLEFEEKRQAHVLNETGRVAEETRRFNEADGTTVSMRAKEEADYRFLAEPDLVKLSIDEEWQGRVRASIPELPDARQARYKVQYELSDYDAAVITASKSLADFFEACLEHTQDAKAVANWIMGELSAYLNANELEVDAVALTPQGLGKMIALIEDGTISNKIAKKVFKEMLEHGGDPEQIVKDKGLVQISDEGQLQQIVDEVVAANPQSVEDFRNGKDRAIGFLVGQVMKATKGQANPQMVNQLIREKLKA